MNPGVFGFGAFFGLIEADIQEIIDDNNLEVASVNEEYNIKIIQDTLRDFCFYTYKQGIATESKVRNFMKAFQNVS